MSGVGHPADSGRWRHRLGIACASGLALSAGARAASLPVEADVDVVVVGGSGAAVAAAQAAAGAGARVLLFTPRRYLGDDLAGSLQLWPKAGEPLTPLARRALIDPAVPPPSAPFSYVADRPANERHPDPPPASRLCRTRPAVNPVTDSVQYDGETVLTVTPASRRPIQAVEVVAFRRAGDFELGRVTGEVSPDGETWTPLPDVAGPSTGSVVRVALPVGGAAAKIRLRLTPAAGAGRLLIGELRLRPTDADGSTAGAVEPPRPLHVKRTLEQALLKSGVRLLFGCYPAGLLEDDAGRVAGVVMVNRRGRQAILARAVIDATDAALLAVGAGAASTERSWAGQTTPWVVLADKPAPSAAADAQVTIRRMPGEVRLFDPSGRRWTGRTAGWWEHRIPLPASTAGWAARAAFEQEIRDLCAQSNQHYTADAPTWPPCRRVAGAATPPLGAAALAEMPNGVFQARATPEVWVLSGCADLPDGVAFGESPAAWMAAGERVGEAAARSALQRPPIAGARARRWRPLQSAADGEGEVRMPAQPLRPMAATGSVPDAPAEWPVLGRYDVVVAGGGTAGAAAGIGAAKNGARTLVIEQLFGLGGVGTLGMIGKYWYGNRVGFAARVPENPTEARMEHLRSELRAAGADIWFGAIGCGAVTAGRRVTGVAVATPLGPGVVKARVVIDATGHADIAAAAGAPTVFVEEFFALQHAHLPPREPGAFYINGDRPAIDPADPLHVTAAMVGFDREAFDRGQLIAARERRRIVGEYTLDWIDIAVQRRFRDTIAVAQSDYDSHGYQVHPFFMLRPTRPPGAPRRQFQAEVPWRCLLPKGLDGLLVAGIALSAHRDALPIVRMQPDVQNVAYAAGIGAAMAARAGVEPRALDLWPLRQALVDEGHLDAHHLAVAADSEISDAEVEDAVDALPPNMEGWETLLAAPERAGPRLRAALTGATGAPALCYALALGVLGDAAGFEILAAELRRRLETDDLPARRPSSEDVNPVEQLIWAIGRSGDPRAASLLSKLADRTAPTGMTARVRALAVTLGQLGDRAAAPSLERLLALRGEPASPETAMLAWALWRCGDPNGVARRRLSGWAASEDAPLAAYAAAALAAGPTPSASVR